MKYFYKKLNSKCYFVRKITLRIEFIVKIFHKNSLYSQCEKDCRLSWLVEHPSVATVTINGKQESGILGIYSRYYCDIYT